MHGKGYVVGGHNGKSYVDTVESFSISSFDGELENVAQLKYLRATPLVSFGTHGFLVVMGGCIDPNMSATIIELINLQSDEHILVELSMGSELDSIRTSLNHSANKNFTSNWKIHPTHYSDKVYLS